MSTNTAPTPEASANQLEIIRSAPLEEVLLDQLTYLIAHSVDRECPEDCRDCKRMAQVADLLLSPFTKPSLLGSTGGR